MQRHALDLTYRGDEHVHRWKPTCSCGWVGVPRRSRTSAELEYHQHVEKNRQKRRLRGANRGVLTPQRDLPMELR